MNYSNGKPIGCNYSGEQASGSGYSHPEKCTIGMTFEELRKTWEIRKQGKDGRHEGMTNKD